MPDQLNTAPMVIAVTWQHEGRAQLGRVGEWELRDGVWTAFVITERGHRGGGWLPADRLESSDHGVVTTFQAYRWWTWEPPAWPPELARFADAGWNEAERDRAEKARPPSLTPGTPESQRLLDLADRVTRGEVRTVPWEETKRRLGL